MEFLPQCYVDFIKYSLDEALPLPKSLGSIDWGKLLCFANSQAIVGIVYEGIKRADKFISIPPTILYQFIGYTQQIELRNREMNERCIEIKGVLKNEGFESCILKGQGNALMYSEPLRRTPGDIDIWLNIENSKSNHLGIKEIIRWVRQINPHGRAEYHHVDYGDYKGVVVEVHYRPSFSNNLIYNRRLQNWFKAQAEKQFAHIEEIPGNEGNICVPTFDFNIVFQLSHIYRHLLKEGIGLRQVIDYYYLLKSLAPNPSPNSVRNLDYTNELHYLGLWKFSGALMWVLREVLGLEEKYLIAPVDKRRGRFLYEEIMRGGNFGQYGADGIMQKKVGRVKKNLNRLKRDIRLLGYFPSECLWEPIFRIYHFFWRLKYN